MTSINTELKGRKEIIEIAKILSTREAGPADLPEMVVLDTNGKQHVLSSIDFPVSLQEWKGMKAGSKIEVTIEEVVKRTTICDR